MSFPAISRANTTSMQPTPPQATDRPPQALSISQMLHLMRVEMDRAQEHGYAISCMMIGLDGFLGEENIAARRSIMPRVFSELKALTGAQNIRGVGLMKEHVLLAVFPHFGPEPTGALAEQLLERASGRADSLMDGQEVRLSIGVGHNQHNGPMSFEILIEEAETGYSLARQGGGNRVIQWKEVEREVDRIKEELEEQIRLIEEQSSQAANALSGEEERWGRDLVEKVLRVFAGEAEKSAAVMRLEHAVISLVSSEVDRWYEFSTVSQLTERGNQIDMLERRLRKLNEHLSVTEAELQRVASMKAIETGVASIYSGVQGLSMDDDHAGAKKGMLMNIFQANLAIREAISEG